MAAGAAAGAWVLVLSLWGEPLPSHQSSLQKTLHPPPHICPELFLEPGRCFSSSLTHLVLVLLALPFPPTPPPLYCLPGAVGGDRNITARIGKPLVLNCRGAPKKPPQQLEWKLVSRAPATASPPPETRDDFASPPPRQTSPFPKDLHCSVPSPLSPEHRSDRSLEGPVSSGRLLGQRSSSAPQRLPPPAGSRDPG